MSKYNRYAKDLDAAFRAARQEYAEAWDKFQAAQNARGQGDAMQRRRAELKYQQAELDFKEAEARIWPEFNRRRAELRGQLEKELRDANAANPDTIDPNGMELLKSGILTADDVFSLVDKYDSNITMLRLISKTAKELADDKNTDAKTRGQLYVLCSQIGNGKNSTMRNFADLAEISNYCSGRGGGGMQRTNPSHTVAMAGKWEELSGNAVENF